MGSAVCPRAKRLTAHERRVRAFQEFAYQLLRRYQDGDFNAKAGVVAGQLDVPLTKVLDELKANVKETFRRGR